MSQISSTRTPEDIGELLICAIKALNAVNTTGKAISEGEFEIIKETGC